ncbi:MAG: alkaline shock response membrane anchor protein AmaP [Fusobacterium sp. JB021]|nr:alkaline shock response membrane anchor protein AmaP [Fusobacterium sp. JB020]MDP0492778.1 alkaline shock response membrane anchor protein AmaP [Fusobacterium sp. JB021]MDP0506327.1 alkaline shock response membrane anchor protein AmaP [Fusobacterium sp. JB019]
MFKKFLFFIAWLGMLILASLGIVYVFVPKYLITFQEDVFFRNVLILTISIIYIFIVIIKFISLFKKEEGYIIKGELGTVNISLDSIKGVIKEILSPDREIRNIKIVCGKKRKKHYILINLDMLTNRSIAEKSEELQKKIKSELQDKLELDIEVIEIKIKKVSLKVKEN